MPKKYYDAKSVDYEAVTVACVPGIYVDERIDRESVPGGIYMYEVRDGGSDGIPAEIANSIAVDFLGTLLTKEPWMFRCISTMRMTGCSMVTLYLWQTLWRAEVKQKYRFEQITGDMSFQRMEQEAACFNTEVGP